MERVNFRKLQKERLSRFFRVKFPTYIYYSQENEPYMNACRARRDKVDIIFNIRRELEDGLHNCAQLT